jgi:hypothetical protein
MSTIFISYRREDSSGHAGRIYDRLAVSFGRKDIFRDIDHIRYGEDFIEAINKAVGSCKALIVIIGPQWLTIKDKQGQRRLEKPYDFVRIEIESALSMGIPIFPVLVGGASMPDADILPSGISGIARIQAIEVSESRFDYDVECLVKELEPKVGPAKQKVNKANGPTNLPQALRKEYLPDSVIHQLSTQSKSEQLRFLDYYKRQKKSTLIAYLLLVFPLPFLGLHNTYLKNWVRQIFFWFTGITIGFILANTIQHPFAQALSMSHDHIQNIFFFSSIMVWPMIDIFLIPSMVIKRNEVIAISYINNRGIKN